MRIAYLTSQYPATSHTFIRREVDAMREQGFLIDTFSIRRPGFSEINSDWDRRAFEGSFYILPVAFSALFAAHFAAFLGQPRLYLSTFTLALKHRAPGMRTLFWAFFHFAESIVLAKEIRRRGITHIHNHFANSAANVGFLTSRFLNLPWSLTLHGISETDYPAGLLLAEKVKAAQFVACVSWFGRAQAMRITPADQWHKFEIVRCGVPLSNIPDLVPHEQPSRIVCVGRLSSEKGHAGLLDAFAHLRDRGILAQLILVGDGPEHDMLKRQCAGLGMSDAVNFVGRKDEQETLAEIARSDLLVLPSLMEGLPVVLMEAMALGVPVVASRVAGIPELIEDGKEGLLFRPADWVDLCDAMTRILSDNALATRLVAAARAKVEAEFDISKVVAPLARRFVAGALDAVPARMVLFDNFDEICIINLAYRTDRRAEMRRELRRVGLENDPRVMFFDAISPEGAGAFSSKGARGVFQSQLAILEQAARRGHSVLILEDDVNFVSGAQDYQLPDGWSIFYGGHYASNPEDLLNSDIIGAHMMGFTASAAKRIHDYLNTLSFTGIHPPIDGAYVWFRRAYPDVRTVFAVPPLGNQRPSRTDIADLRFFDRLPGLREAASLARKVKPLLVRRR